MYRIIVVRFTSDASHRDNPATVILYHRELPGYNNLNNYEPISLF